MLDYNPWDNVLQLILFSGDADNLSTTSIDVLNRLSDKANPDTGVCAVELELLAREAKRDIALVKQDLLELINNKVIQKQQSLEQAIITLHERVTEQVEHRL